MSEISTVMPKARAKQRTKTTSRRPRPGAAAAPPAAAGHLEFKVVELSQVDESSLERTLNEWTRYGWTFDGVQFAMRESSRRPAMAFVFLTRPGKAALGDSADAGAFRDPVEAQRHLARLAGAPAATGPVSAWARLEAMAGEGDE